MLSNSKALKNPLVEIKMILLKSNGVVPMPVAVHSVII